MSGGTGASPRGDGRAELDLDDLAGGARPNALEQVGLHGDEGLDPGRIAHFDEQPAALPGHGSADLGGPRAHQSGPRAFEARDDPSALTLRAAEQMEDYVGDGFHGVTS